MKQRVRFFLLQTFNGIPVSQMTTDMFHLS